MSIQEKRRLQRLQKELDTRQKKLDEDETKFASKQKTYKAAAVKLRRDQKKVELDREKQRKSQLSQSASHTTHAHKSKARSDHKHGAEVHKMKEELKDTKVQLSKTKKEVRELRMLGDGKDALITSLKRQLKKAGRGKKEIGDDKMIKQLKRERANLKKRLELAQQLKPSKHDEQKCIDEDDITDEEEANAEEDELIYMSESDSDKEEEILDDSKEEDDDDDDAFVDHTDEIYSELMEELAHRSKDLQHIYEIYGNDGSDDTQDGALKELWQSVVDRHEKWTAKLTDELCYELSDELPEMNKKWHDAIDKVQNSVIIIRYRARTKGKREGFDEAVATGADDSKKEEELGYSVRAKEQMLAALNGRIDDLMQLNAIYSHHEDAASIVCKVREFMENVDDRHDNIIIELSELPSSHKIDALSAEELRKWKDLICKTGQEMDENNALRLELCSRTRDLEKAVKEVDEDEEPHAHVLNALVDDIEKRTEKKKAENAKKKAQLSDKERAVERDQEEWLKIMKIFGVEAKEDKDYFASSEAKQRGVCDDEEPLDVICDEEKIKPQKEVEIATETNSIVTPPQDEPKIVSEKEPRVEKVTKAAKIEPRSVAKAAPHPELQQFKILAGLMPKEDKTKGRRPQSPKSPRTKRMQEARLSTPGVCTYYGSVVGCTNGNRCVYSHANPNSVRFCKFYNQRFGGGCHHGKNCKFRHTTHINPEMKEILSRPLPNAKDKAFAEARLRQVMEMQLMK
eukprot:182567_1